MDVKGITTVMKDYERKFIELVVSHRGICGYMVDEWNRCYSRDLHKRNMCSVCRDMKYSATCLSLDNKVNMFNKASKELKLLKLEELKSL